MATVEPVRAMPSALHYGQETFDRDFDAIHESSVEADMYFLQRDELWETEKPYGMRYYAEGIAQSNVRREKHRIVLKDIRQLTIAPSVDVQGFSVMALDSRMAYEDFNDYSKIKLIYHQDIIAALKKTLGAKHVFVMDNAVCACYLQLLRTPTPDSENRFVAEKQTSQFPKGRTTNGISPRLCHTLVRGSVVSKPRESLIQARLHTGRSRSHANDPVWKTRARGSECSVAGHQVCHLSLVI